MILLCANQESVQQPVLLDLAGENLLAQQWLEVQVSAREARRASRVFEEIWVVSSNDIEAINLAAALKKDHQGVPVYLVAAEGTGSLKSRAKAANLDAVISQKQMVERYRSFKRRNMLGRTDSFTHEKQETTKPVLTDVFPVSSGSSHSSLIIPVLSATGGSGKSSISVLLAFLSQKRGYNTLLIDADLQFGDAHFLMGSSQALTVSKALANPLLLSQLNTKRNSPALLAAPNNLEQSEIVSTQIASLLEHCSTYFEVIIINTGAFWAEQHIALLEKATRAVFLLDQRPSSIRDCNHALEYCARCAVATQPLRFVLNRCSRNAIFSSIDASCGLQGAPVVELQDGGRVVSELLGAGQPADLIASKNALCVSLEKIIEDVLPEKNEKSSLNAKGDRFKRAKKPRFWRKKEAACL